MHQNLFPPLSLNLLVTLLSAIIYLTIFLQAAFVTLKRKIPFQKIVLSATLLAIILFPLRSIIRPPYQMFINIFFIIITIWVTEKNIKLGEAIIIVVLIQMMVIIGSIGISLPFLKDHFEFLLKNPYGFALGILIETVPIAAWLIVVYLRRNLIKR